MKKDVIYIDIEDDITSIIARIKQASAKIVALVPPKRVGALQSAVNLKLLQRAAGSVSKRVVIITSDKALGSLAASVSIPVAKNLQSKPEVLPLGSGIDQGTNDVINGEDLPIEELAQMSATSAAALGTQTGGLATASAANPASAAAGSSAVASPAATTPPKAGTGKAPKGGLAGKIPNFDTFRKKLFIFGGLGVLLVGFFVWALIFAPKATVTITAKTNAVPLARNITLDPGAATDPQLARIKPEVKQIKKTASAEFDTTGTKEIGERARGTLTLANSNGQAVSVPAGTTFSAQNLQFTSTAAVTVPAATVCRPRTVCDGRAEVAVTAAAIGPEYNLVPQAYTTSADVDAAGGAMAGGNKEKVNVVSAEDVEKAKQQLKAQDEAAIKQELGKQFTGNTITIAESYRAEPAQPSVAPAIGEQARRARISGETTYTLIGVPRADVDDVLDDMLSKQIKNKSERRVYSNGSRTLKFNQFQQGEGGIATVQLAATGHIGPTINEQRLKEQVTGLRYGEIEQLINSIEGVENVTIDMSPFWVTEAPDAEDVTINFTVKSDGR